MKLETALNEIVTTAILHISINMKIKEIGVMKMQNGIMKLI